MKKRSLLKMSALALALALVFAGCGQEKNPDSAVSENGADPKGEIKNLSLAKLSANEMDTFNMLYSQKQPNSENLTNMWDGLLELDNKGKLVPAIAESWETKDNGKTWTFKIRDGVKWVDINANEKADCNAYDFATGLEWVLNFHKNESHNTSMPNEMIEGASEYYEYTKTLSKEEAYALKAGEGSKFSEMVGIKTPDAHTVVYTCTTEKPYFDTLAPYAALYPISQALVDELGVDGIKSMDNRNVWYNGCYIMTTYVQSNEKVFTKNPKYWDTDCKRFDTVTIKMVESGDITYQLYESGEIDYTGLNESNVKIISENENHRFHDCIIPGVSDMYAEHIHFCFDKLNKDGSPDLNWNKAVANEAFRKSIYYGVDFTDYAKRWNTLDPYSCVNYFYTMKGLVYTSDGRDYTELVRDNLGLPEDSNEKIIRLDAAKGQEYKKQAMEELKAMGVVFPVDMDMYIKAGNRTAADSLTIFKNCIERDLGSDYIRVNIKEYVTSLSKEVITPKLGSIYLTGWGADYGDPINYLHQEVLHSDSAYMSTSYSAAYDLKEEDYNKDLLAAYEEFTKMVAEADKITSDLDERYKAFAKAEAQFIDHALVVPLNYRKGLALGKIDNSSRIFGIFGCQNEKMKNWETNSAGYTTEEAKANAEAKK